MKAILFMFVAIAATTILLDVYASVPFEISETGVNVESYQLDTEMNSIILELEVIDSEGILEITFEREFFDAIYQDQDDKFLIIADGDLLAYKETKTTQSRTIILNLISDVDEVEIFGSHLMGKTVDQNDINISEIQEQNVQLSDEKELLTKQVSVLSTELEDMKVQENLLQEENEKLGKKIFEPDNLIKETEVQANNFGSGVMKKINSFTTWINSFF
ncbi:MAG: hypothetical protein HRO68_05225 [Nitrosopumilus sp.]|nr:hypothetical protein [Nitrosopumilus sp.]